ncbi:MAG: hypothetical protein M0R46_11180 [Candidatus Muirbacterium halophilum]|nr:hypothetical protein [Candidatus Muirbacterium halophilum]MCK9476475.1 hypothetical protein [Candidatus Muirbacterium halophilum]
MTLFKKRIIFNICLLLIVLSLSSIIYNFETIAEHIIKTAYKDILDKPLYKIPEIPELTEFAHFYNKELNENFNEINMKFYLIKNDIEKNFYSPRIKLLRSIPFDKNDKFPVFTKENIEFLNQRDFIALPLGLKYINLFFLFDFADCKIKDLISQKKYNEALIIYEKLCYMSCVISYKIDSWESKWISYNIQQLAFITIKNYFLTDKDFPKNEFLKITALLNKYLLDYDNINKKSKTILKNYRLNFNFSSFDYLYDKYRANTKFKKILLLTPDLFIAINDMFFTKEKNKIKNILPQISENSLDFIHNNKFIKYSLFANEIKNIIFTATNNREMYQKLMVILAAYDFISKKTDIALDPINNGELKIIKKQNRMIFISSGKNKQFEEVTKSHKSSITYDDISVSFNI